MTVVKHVLWLAGAAALAGCGIDDTLKNPPEEAPATYTILVNVQPPTTLRTEETWGQWTVPVQAVFRTSFTTSAAGEDHASKAVADEGEYFIGRSVVEGFGIALEAEAAQPLWTMGHGGMMEMHAPDAGQTHHLKVMLEDGLGGHPPHGNANVPGARVRVEAIVNGEEQGVDLRPVQGRHGLRYEANAAIPPGTYDLKVHVTPPSLVRTEATKDRWLSEIEADLPAYDFSSGRGTGSAEIDGMKVSVSAGAPKTYGALGMGHIPLRGDETVSFSVRLEDTATAASGEGELLAHCGVNVTLINEDTGASSTLALSSMYGGHGFHYGGNLGLPMAGNTVGGSTPAGGGHADDGHTD